MSTNMPDVSSAPDPLSVFTSLMSGTLDGTLHALALVSVFFALVAGAVFTLAVVVYIALSAPEWWEYLMLHTLLALDALVTRVVTFLRARGLVSRDTAHQRRAPRQSDVPPSLRLRARALCDLRTRVDEGDLSEYYEHHAVGIGREQGYQLVYGEPIIRIDDAIADALARLDAPSDAQVDTRDDDNTSDTWR